MPTAKFRGSRLRSRPFVTTIVFLSVLTAYSVLLQNYRYGRHEQQHDAPQRPLFRREKEPVCGDVHSATDQCAFVKKYCLDEDAGLVPYLEWYFCSFNGIRPIGFTLLIIWLGLLFTTIGIAASDFFSVNLSTIATILGLSESLAGVTFLAFGNGSPDVFSTFAAMSSNSPGMAVGELIGAACFISGVVAGSMALVREFRVDRKTYARDICFFIVAVAFAMIFLADGHLRFWECWVMVGYYIIYVVTVVGCHWYSTRRKRRLRREGEARSHFYGMVGHSGDELAGEPYRDEPETPHDDVRDDSHSASITTDISTLERGPRIEFENQDQDSDAQGSNEDGSDGDHERMVAAEVSRSMRVLRAGKNRSTQLNPIRPSLVGALEFRSALAQLQRESNLQLSHIPGRSYSDYHVTGRERRGTTSVVPDSGLWETVSTPGVGPRERAFSYGATAAASAPLPTLEDVESSSDTDSNLAVPGHAASAHATTTSTPYVVGGSLAPPPVGPSGTIDTAKMAEGGHGHGRQPDALRLVIPSRRSSHSEGSSPASPFPRYTDSPSPMTVTPNPHSERTEFMLPPPVAPHRDGHFPDMSETVVVPRRPVRWWPYSLLPPPHVVLATLFPTLQAWGEKTIWDKFLSTISVPSIFLLVITLPVVESETNESSVDDLTILDGSSHRDLGHAAPPVSVEPQQIEPEGEWERYRRYTRSRRNSRASVEVSSPQLLITLENDDTAVASQGETTNTHTVAKPLSDMPSISNANDEPSTWNRWLVCVQLFTGPLFAVMILWANMAEEFSDPGRTLVKMILYTLLASLVLLAFLFLFTSDHKRPKYHFLLCFLGFIISIAWISTIAGEVVGVLKTFGVVLNISEALLGLTIFAAGNSVGDLVADITVARLGYPVMALSACFGGPMLNILLGIGIGGVLMMVQNANKKHAKHPDRPIQYGPYSVEVGPTLMISAVTLLIILVLLLIIVPLNKWILSRKIGWGLITLWTLSTIANVVVEVTGVWQES